MAQRCLIKYGIPDEERVNRNAEQKKRIAIPYEAANVPSKRNDFAQPDVALFLTYMAYYNS